MADLRTSVGSPLTPNPQSLGLRPAATAAKTEAVRAAQRAFFEAAMNQAAASPTTARATTASATAAPVRVTGVTGSFDPQQPPTRILRPGSLIDIKV